MKENIFEKKIAHALICEDVSQSNKAIGMAIVGIICFALGYTSIYAEHRQHLPRTTVFFQLLDLDSKGE